MNACPHAGGSPVTATTPNTGSLEAPLRGALAAGHGPLPPNPTVRQIRAVKAGAERWAGIKRDPYWLTRGSIPTVSASLRGLGALTLAPPGPRGRPVVGCIGAMRREPFEFFRRCAAQYGDIYQIPVPAGNLVIVNHPDYAGQVMDDPNGRYSMIGPFGATVALFGAAIPMLEGDKFRQRRRMLMPLFGRRHLARVADVIADEFVQRIDAWGSWADDGQVVDLQHQIAQVTLPAFLRAMFSSSITDREIHETDIDIRTFMSLMAAPTMMSPRPKLLPGRDRTSALTSMRRLRSLSRRLARERRENPIDKPDLLSLLLEARYDDGSPLSERDLTMELMILMAGGYETVVASLSWTLALLLSNPGHLTTLQAEVDALGGAVPTPADLPRLTWAKACFDEGQRLQGHPLNPRFAMDDDVIGGYLVPRYSIVGPSLYSMHRDPRWWPEPDIYDPNRFIDDSLVGGRPRLAFMPFGSGRHHCIGTGMAYMNAQFLLALIFQRYRLSLPPGWTPRHNFNFSVTVKDGLPVRLARR